MNSNTIKEVSDELSRAERCLAAIEAGCPPVYLRANDWLNAIARIAVAADKVNELRAVLDIARNQLEKIPAATSAA